MSEIQVAEAEIPERSTRQAIRRGLACRCPACGEASLFSSYLKVAPACTHCGEELHHHRADDGPAYLTMLIVCHIAGVMLMMLYRSTDLSPGMVATIVMASVVPMSLLMLPRAKGFLVGFQWAKRMHGFGGAGRD